MLLTLPSFVSFHVAAGTILPLAIFGVSLGVASSLSVASILCSSSFSLLVCLAIFSFVIIPFPPGV